MKRKSKWKGLVIALIVVAVIAGAGFGGWYFLQNRNTEPVKVIPFQYVGMTEYWGDNRESSGMVSTDRIQTVFLTGTQRVTEILVEPGDAVKKGDVLLTYDTTLSDLALEREELAVDKLKLQLDNAQDELEAIKKMKPMVTPKPTPVPDIVPETGVALKGDYQLSENPAYDGTAPEKARILWLRDGIELSDELFDAIFPQPDMPPEEDITPPENVTPDPEETPPTSEDETTETEEETTETEGETTETEGETTETEGETTETEGETTVPEGDTTASTGDSSNTVPSDPPSGPVVPPVSPVDPTPGSSEEPSEELPEEPQSFFVVIKVTEGNMSMTYAKMWQGMEVIREGGTYRFRFFDASFLSDYTVVRQEIVIPTPPKVDLGSGYTAKEIAQMRAEKEKQIKDLKFQVKMAEANFAIKKTEAENGKVVAKIDGTVVSLLSEEEANSTMQPLIKISGGGGFYVKATVSELEKEELQIGQQVTVNDWNTGMVYTGSVQSIGDFPDPNGYWNGMGNPNVSYYPFTVFIDGSADLQEGAYVNVVYSTASNQQGIYLENPFLRTEQGRSYVYVRGADGKLEQRFVTTGKILWGNYTEILSGLTAEDMVAFPYGKHLIVGADTVESDLSELYG